ncbi:MAG: hypothetical protein H6Q89_2350 [Myxococcaceae bacterium]|nr:hypothetical protein [Myxococcaceae bacterium]
MNELAKPDRSAQSVTELRKEVDESRRRLAESADALRADLRENVLELKRGAHELKEKLNWKTWVARNPWGFVLGAVAVGIFLGTRDRS